MACHYFCTDGVLAVGEARPRTVAPLPRRGRLRAALQQKTPSIAKKGVRGWLQTLPLTRQWRLEIGFGQNLDELFFGVLPVNTARHGNLIDEQ